MFFFFFWGGGGGGGGVDNSRIIFLFYDNFRDTFSYFSLKPYVVTPHLNHLVETVQMKGQNVCVYAELIKIVPNIKYSLFNLELRIWKITPKLSRLPLPIWNTTCLQQVLQRRSLFIGKNNMINTETVGEKFS